MGGGGLEVWGMHIANLLETPQKIEIQIGKEDWGGCVGKKGGGKKEGVEQKN